MLIVFAVEECLDEFMAKRGRVVTPRPERCPACGHGRVTFAGWRTRQTRQGVVDIHRVRCADPGCAKTHSCWPDVLVGRRVDPAATIGAGLEAKAAGLGHRRIAARLAVAQGTARGGLRRFALIAPALTATLIALAAAADPVLRPPPPGCPLAVGVAAVGLAAAGMASLTGEPVDRWRLAVAVAGGGLLDRPTRAAPDMGG